MFTDKKTHVITSQLTRLTVEGKLKWSRTNPPDELAAGTSSKFSFFAEAIYKNINKIAYCEERYKYYKDEEDYEWCENNKLVLMGLDRRMLYTFPKTSALNDLEQAIKEQLANIDVLFSDLLEGFDPSANLVSDEDLPF